MLIYFQLETNVGSTMDYAGLPATSNISTVVKQWLWRPRPAPYDTQTQEKTACAAKIESQLSDAGSTSSEGHQILHMSHIQNDKTKPHLKLQHYRERRYYLLQQAKVHDSLLITSMSSGSASSTLGSSDASSQRSKNSSKALPPS